PQSRCGNALPAVAPEPAYDQGCRQKDTQRRMPTTRCRGSVCTMALGPLRHPWVRIAAQIVVLELIVILSTLTAARFHPNSRPVDAIAIGLAVIAAGAIGVSGRWPGAAVGIALLSVLTYHWI